MAKHNETGKTGENLASQWIENRGFGIIERNYRKKWGEIDIVARETGIIHFIEVKAVSYETRIDLEYAVSHETWRPEENVHTEKKKRFSRAIETWILENRYQGEWQIDVVTVRLVPREKYAVIKLIDNVIFE